MENAPQLKTESEKLPELQDAASNLIAQEQAANIVTAEDNDKATDLAKLLRDYKKKLDDDRKTITDPLNQVVKGVNARYKPTMDLIDEAIASLKTKMTRFARSEAERIRQEQEEARRQAEEEALEKAGDVSPEEAETILAEAAEKGSAIANQATQVRGAGSVVGGSSFTKSELKVSISDASQVPVEFLSVDLAKVNARVDAVKAQYRAEGVGQDLSGAALTKYANEKTAANLKIAGITIVADIGVSVR